MHCLRQLAMGSLLLGVVGLATAQVSEGTAAQRCSATQLAQLGTQLGVSRFTQSEMGVVVSAACKVWPKDNSKTIVAVGYSTAVETEKAIVVAISETGSGKVDSLYRSKVEEDAGTELHAGSLKIDTGRYDLAPEVRAFAVDMESNGRGASCPEGGSGAMRTLFVQNGSAIRPVLENLALEDWQYVSGGPAMCNLGNAETVVEKFPTSVGISKATSNGFADLVISIASKLDNAKKSKRQPFQYVLKYDGRQYPTKEMERAYWKWRQ